MHRPNLERKVLSTSMAEPHKSSRYPSSMKSTTRRLNRWANQYLMLFLTVAVLLSLLLIAFGSWNAGQISQGFKKIVTTEFRLQQLSGEIIHLDEVLTMSARMAATTGDLKWEQRYRTYEPQLDNAIKQSTQLAPEVYAKYATQTDAANVKLVEMEKQAFDRERQSSFRWSVQRGHPVCQAS